MTSNVRAALHSCVASEGYGEPMRSRKEIQKKLAQVRYRHLKKLTRTGLSRRPCNCVYNVTLGDGGKPKEPAVGVCTYKVLEGRNPDGICDEKFGGNARAGGCPVFEANKTADEIKEEFDSFLAEASFGEIAYHFPDMAALLWVLQKTPEEQTAVPEGEILEVIAEGLKPSTDPLREYPPLEDLLARDDNHPYYLELLRRFRG